jgi:hypothetical protein
MSDAEHELIVDNVDLREDNVDLREEVVRLGDIVHRSLAAALEAQDAAFGHHEAWIDEAILETVARAR